MNTKKLMTKVTLGAAMILTTAAVATTAVVPNVVRADDTTIADKDAKVFTVYGFNGTVFKASYNEVYDAKYGLSGLAKIRDFVYTVIDPYTGYWAVGPNGEQDYNPNAVKPAPVPPTTTETTESTTQTTTTPSTTEPTTTEPAKQVIEQIRIVKFETEYQADETVKLGEQVLVREGKDGRELVETFADGTPQKVTVLEDVVNAVYKVNPSDERVTFKPVDNSKPVDKTTTTTSEKPEDKSVTNPSTTETKSSTQATTTTPTKEKEEIKTLPKAGDASILSMLAGTGILSGFGLSGLKRKFKK